MATPPNGNTWKNGFANARNTGNPGAGRASGGTGGRARNGGTKHYHVHVGTQPNQGRGKSAGPGGGFFSRGAGGGQRAGHSPLADPEFFNSTDVRNYCEQARAVFLQLSFELAGAAEVLNGALREVPDANGNRFGSRARARRVSKKLKKTADDVRDAAKNAVATYAAFQREFEPELAHYRARAPRGRRFDFNL